MSGMGLEEASQPRPAPGLSGGGRGGGQVGTWSGLEEIQSTSFKVIFFFPGRKRAVLQPNFNSRYCTGVTCTSPRFAGTTVSLNTTEGWVLQNYPLCPRIPAFLWGTRAF